MKTIANNVKIFSMLNHMIYIIVCVFCSLITAHAQQKPSTNCSQFDSLSQAATEAIKQKNYSKAITMIEAANRACPSKVQEIAMLYKKINIIIQYEIMNSRKLIDQIVEQNKKLEAINTSLHLANNELQETLLAKDRAESLLSKAQFEKILADSLLNQSIRQKAVVESLVAAYNDKVITSQSQLLKMKNDRDSLKTLFIDLGAKKLIADSILRRKFFQLEMADYDLRNLKNQIIESEDELSKIRNDRERTLKLLARTEQRRSLQTDLTKLIEHISVLERNRQYAFLGLSIPILLGILSAFFYSRSRKEKELLHNRS